MRNDSLLHVSFIGMGIAWLVFASLLLNRLESKHLSKFIELGRPALSRYGIGGAALRFVVSRGHRTLNDVWLSIFSDGVLLIFAVGLLAVVYDIIFGLSH